MSLGTVSADQIAAVNRLLAGAAPQGGRKGAVTP
jgi:hypothetical protein